jgi:uncharacterized protein YkvS
MNKVQTAIDAIRNMNNDELNQVVAAIKLQRTWLARTTTAALAVGDMVEFKGRYGNTERGRVTKINPKTVIVDAGHTRWKVPASLLKVVDMA